MADYPDYITGPAAANGLDPNMFARFAHVESSGNPNARTGSYKGLFQLSDDEFNRHGGGNIYNPYDNANAAAAKIAAEGAQFRQNYGRDPTAADYYLIHQQGQAGYGAHLANPDAPAWQNMYSTGEGRQKGAGWSRQAIWGNVPDNYKRQFGSVDNVTSQDFVNMWRNRIEGDGASPMSFGGNNNMPAPALSANNTLGPGALSNGWMGVPGGGQYDLGTTGQNVGAWLMAAGGQPAALGAIQRRDDYSIVPGQDGSMYQLNKHDGSVRQISGPITKLQTFDTGEGLFGKRPQGFFNPRTGETYNGGAGGSSGDAADLQQVVKPGVQWDDSLQGNDRLAQMRPQFAADIKGYFNGDELPSARSDKYKAWVAREARSYGAAIGEPVSDATFKAKQTARTEMADPMSKLGQQRSAVNTMLEQTAGIADAYNKITDIGIRPLNQAGNAVQDWLGYGSRAEALGSIKGKLNALAEEATRLARGNQGAEADIKRLISQADPNMPAPVFYNQLKAIVDTARARATESQAGLQNTFKSSPELVAGYPMIRPESGGAALDRFTQHYNRVHPPGGQQQQAPAAGTLPTDWGAAQKAGWK